MAPNIHRTQNTDTGRKTQTQLITGLKVRGSSKQAEGIRLP